jgi:hypothetical protein
MADKQISFISTLGVELSTSKDVMCCIFHTSLTHKTRHLLFMDFSLVCLLIIMRQASNRGKKSIMGLKPPQQNVTPCCIPPCPWAVPSSDVLSNGHFMVKIAAVNSPKKTGKFLAWLKPENGTCPIKGYLR